ncbi:MAG: hypothetical protein Q7J03_04595 [Methanoregula sp.]|nr:hypothetical protein [Methanoregula sp.]
MSPRPVIQHIYPVFSRHDRRYCVFSVNGRDEEYLYYSHISRPLRSLMYGRDFVSHLPRLRENEDLCIECGLGLLMAGGVALDKGECIAWHCSVEEANLVLTGLKERMGEEGQWIELF